jgi:general secretion pathway protein A
MYESFYGFRERPFDLTPSPRFLVLTDVHREALSNLQYGIASGKGITLLIGDAGTGKTTLIRTALERQPARVHCVHMHNPALTRTEFVQMLAARFELSDDARSSKATLLLELERLLRERRDAGHSTLLVLDEAQSLSLDLLEEIRLLANIETNEEKLLSLIIAGQPELADRLNDPALRQLKQRVALRCELRPLTRIETAGYIAGRVRAAGGVGAHVFTREAVTLIHERSTGIPRIISVIADNALVTGFAIGQRPVSSATVREVCRDFDFDAERAGDKPAPIDAPAAPSAAPEFDRGRAFSFETAQAEAPGSPTGPVRHPDTPRAAEPDVATSDAAAEPRGTTAAAMYAKRRRFSFF